MMELRLVRCKCWAQLLIRLVTLLLLLSGCGSGGDAGGGSSSESGSISFDLAMQDPSEQSSILQSPSGDICADYFIDTIDATVRNAAGTVVASATWPCSTHRGTMSNVPSGSDLTLTIDGIVAGNQDWQYQTPAISVSQAQDADVGTVELIYNGADQTAPTILSHNPDSNAVDISLNSAIIVTFSEDMVPASVISAISLSGTTEIPGDINYDPSSSRATFTPATALGKNTQYTIKIAETAQDRAGHRITEPYASTFTTGDKSDVIPPTAPNLLDVTAVSNSQIDLSWEAASDNVAVTSYRVLRDGTHVKSVSTTWATDTNLTPNTEYCYTIVAADAADNPSNESNKECATTQPTPAPPTPSLISPAIGAELDNNCENNSDSIEWDFDWEDTTDATQYRIRVIRTGATDPLIDEVVNSSSYHYASKDYIPNTNRLGWTWKVRADNNADIWSEWSPERNFDIEPVNQDCAYGLVAYYPFNGNANDASGYELHGTVNGAVLTTDRFDNQSSAYLFNGSNSDIEVLDSTLLDIKNQISLMAWIYPAEQKTQEIVRKGTQLTSSTTYALALSATGDIIFEAAPGGQFTQVRRQGYSLNQWSFIAGTYDGTEMKLYVNGELASTIAVTGELNVNASALLMGTRLNLPADTFNGKLDGIRIYNKALTDDEIASLYEQP